MHTRIKHISSTVELSNIVGGKLFFRKPVKFSGIKFKSSDGQGSLYCEKPEICPECHGLAPH